MENATKKLSRTHRCTGKGGVRNNCQLQQQEFDNPLTKSGKWTVISVVYFESFTDDDGSYAVIM